MPDNQTLDAQGIAAELRAIIRKARVVGRPAPGAGFQPEPQIDADLQILRSTYNVASAPFTSHRRFLGRLIIPVKNFARELLVQLLARQSVYNGAATLVIAHLNQRLNSLAEEHARIAQRLAALEANMDGDRMATPGPQEHAGAGHRASFEAGEADDDRAGVPTDIPERRERGTRKRP